MNRYARVKAEIKRELDRLADLNNGLRPSEVVEAATPKKSPLHEEFEWDDKKAGHEFRLLRARRLIRIAITVDTSPSGDEVVTDRYVHVPPIQAEQDNPKAREGVYLRMSDVVKNDDYFSRALAALVANVNRARASAQELRDAATHSSADPDRMARIAMAITALETAGAAVAALH
jgi:hypothetical protein